MLLFKSCENVWDAGTKIIKNKKEVL